MAVDAVAERSSIHKVKASRCAAVVLAINLLGNVGLVVYSHIGLSFETFSNVDYATQADPTPAPAPAPPTPAPTPSPTDPTPSPAPPGETPAPTPAPSDFCARRRLTAVGCSPADRALAGDREAYTATAGKCGLNQCAFQVLGKQPGCMQDCLVAKDLSTTCAKCVEDLTFCSVECLGDCLNDVWDQRCLTCQDQAGCLAVWQTCSGYDYRELFFPDQYQGPPSQPTEQETLWYTVGDQGRISFTNSVTKLWNAGAPGLAVVLAIASGMNPYLECVLLAVAYFVPMGIRARGRLLWWINRVGRWSFLDVFLIVVLCAGLSKLQFLNGGIELAVETKGAIYAFGLATIWARWLGNWVEEAHRTVSGSEPRMAIRCLRNSTSKQLKLVLGVSCLGLFGITIVALVSPFIIFEVKEEAFEDDVREYTPVSLGVESGERDLAGVKSVFLLTVPYLVWGVLLPTISAAFVLIALPLGKFKPSVAKFLLAACDMMGSAASVDVLLVAGGIMSHHFGDLINLILTCVNEDLGRVANAQSKGAWGFYLLIAAAPFQWVMQEVALALHDQSSKEDNQSSKDEVEVGVKEAGNEDP